MKRLGVVRIALVVLTIVVLQASCAVVQKILDPAKKERKAIVTKSYHKDGLRFSYPDNWKVTEDTILENNVRHVNVEDGDNTLFIIQIMSSDYEVDLEDHAGNVVKEIRTSLPVGNVVKVAFGTASREFSGKKYDGVRREYSVSVLGQTLPHTIDLFLIRGETANALVMIQAPDDDLKAAEKEVQTIADSLRFE